MFTNYHMIVMNSLKRKINRLIKHCALASVQLNELWQDKATSRRRTCIKRRKLADLNLGLVITPMLLRR